MPICIAGMHRAGTSMVARLLDGCGLDLGGAANFAPPAPDNRDGYWEDLRFVALNERILDRFQGAWDHPPALPKGWEASATVEPERRDAAALVQTRSEPWGWKDPRNSLTLPFWRRLLPGLRVIICVRNPLEVADSLRARGYTSERFGLALWESYHRAIEETVDSSLSLVTHYESFLADPRAEMERVLGFLALQPSAGVREAVLSAASPGARHQRRTSAEVEASGLSAEGKRLYAALRDRSGPVYAELRQREPSAPPPPAPRDEAAPPGLAEQLAEVLAVLEAREVELASIKPVLVARTEEVDALTRALAAHASEMAALRAALDASHALLAERERLLGSLVGVLKAIKRLLVPAR
jgi:hypothetical protein